VNPYARLRAELLERRVGIRREIVCDVTNFRCGHARSLGVWNSGVWVCRPCRTEHKRAWAMRRRVGPG
jgi:hypothetical protein